MLTIIADAMLTATRTKRGTDIPEYPKGHADRHIPTDQRRPKKRPYKFNPNSDLW